MKQREKVAFTVDELIAATKDAKCQQIIIRGKFTNAPSVLVFLRGNQSRPRKSGQGDKWSFCLTAAMCRGSGETMTRRPRRNHTPAFKAKVALGRHQGREDAGRAGAAV